MKCQLNRNNSHGSPSASMISSNPDLCSVGVFLEWIGVQKGDQDMTFFPVYICGVSMRVVLCLTLLTAFIGGPVDDYPGFIKFYQVLSSFIKFNRGF